MLLRRRHRHALLAAITATIAALGLTSVTAANASSAPRPYFLEWRPGTPLPKVPAGFNLVAWPAQSAMRHLRAGERMSIMPVTLRAHMATAYRSLENPSGIVDLEAMPDASEAPASCSGSTFLGDLGTTTVNVAQSFVLDSGINQTFHYGDGQSSSLGVGISASGDAGSFSADGTTSVSTTGSQSFPIYSKDNIHWETDFAIGEWLQEADCDVYDIIKPYEWAGGDTMVFVSGHPSTPYCIWETAGKGVGLTQSTTTATTFSVGYNAPDDLGFSGTGQTGYSTTAATSLGFPTVSGNACGQDNYPQGEDPGPGVILGTTG
jgi:hypothetical protein